MAVSFSHKQVASCCVPPVACLILALLLSGCAGTPKTAATRFDSFAQVTSSLGTQVVGAYVLDDTIAKKERTLKFINDYTTDSSVFLVPPTKSPAPLLVARQTLMLGLATYANGLKNIMNDEPLNTVSEQAQVVGKQLEGMQSDFAALTPIQLPEGISPVDMGKTVGEFAKLLMDFNRRAYLKTFILDMNPHIQSIVTFLKQDIGTCETVQYGGITYYCLGDDKETFGAIPKDDLTLQSGLGEDYCKFFVRIQKQFQTKIYSSSTNSGSPKKNVSPVKVSTSQLSGDQQKIVEQQAALNWKAKYACDGLDLLKKSLSDFASIHTLLHTALDGKSRTLADELAKLTVQLTVVNQLFENAAVN